MTRSIWTYEEQSENVPRYDIYKCCYCDSTMLILRSDGWVEGPISEKSSWSGYAEACSECGWWIVSSEYGSRDTSGETWIQSRAVGTLRRLDVSDIATPLEELRRYLLVQYHRRFELNPRRFEQLVASVFSGVGYRVRVTSFSGDDGIDIVILDGVNDVVGIQVKRYREKIEAAQIRELAGSLVLNGLTTGVFVTTSAFTQGAINTAARFTNQGIPISLVDASTFYDRLKLRQRAAYEVSNDPSAPFFELLTHPERLTVIRRTGINYD